MTFPFTSSLTRREAICVLLYLPLQMALLPLGIGYLAARAGIDLAWANFLYYDVGFCYMLLAGFRFLRRDFDPLADRPFYVLARILTSYALLMLCNIATANIILHFLPESRNENNEALLEMVTQNAGPMKAALIFLAPMVEEMLFRAGVFGTLRKRSRLAAYLVSALLFAVYHVWSYVVDNPAYWLYLLEYIPAGLLLARCYERCNSIWGSIGFHMLVNAMSLSLYEVASQLGA